MNSEQSLQQQQNISNENAGGTSSPSNLFGQLFSSAFGAMKWFVGLRWYVILFIVVFGSYLFFQMEYAVESRRRSKELKREDANKKEGEQEDANKKEGMEEYKVEKMKGILRQSRSDQNVKKRVSFYNEDPTTSLMSQIYNLWILPWIYVLFRNTGIRT